MNAALHRIRKTQFYSSARRTVRGWILVSAGIGRVYHFLVQVFKIDPETSLREQKSSLKNPETFLRAPGMFLRAPGTFLRLPGMFLKASGMFLRLPGTFLKAPGMFLRLSGTFLELQECF